MQSYLQRLIDINLAIEDAEAGLELYLKWMIDNGYLPQTAKLFTLVLDHTDMLKRSLYNAADIGDVMCCKMLYRTLIEQYIRFVYLFVRIMRKPNDTVAERYVAALKIAEEFAHERAIATASAEYHHQDIAPQAMWNILTIPYPHLWAYTLPGALLLLEEFSWERITRFLEREKQTDGTHITTLIREHAFLLRFVQGGASVFEVLDPLSEDDRHRELERLCTVSLEITTDISILCCALFEPYRKGFDAIGRRINQAFQQLYQPQDDTKHSQTP